MTQAQPTICPHYPPTPQPWNTAALQSGVTFSPIGQGLTLDPGGAGIVFSWLPNATYTCRGCGAQLQQSPRADAATGGQQTVNALYPGDSAPASAAWVFGL